MPCKNFFLSSLTPTCSFTSYPSYPLPLSICSTGTSLNCKPFLAVRYNVKLPTVLMSGTTLNCQLGFPLQVLQMTSTSLNYHPESCDMPSGHMLPPPPLHETDNMPSSCLTSPKTSGCTTLTCTIPLTITFPGCHPYGRRHIQDIRSPLKRRSICKTVTLSSQYVLYLSLILQNHCYMILICGCKDSA
jgi:hypothetical protein